MAQKVDLFHQPNKYGCTCNVKYEDCTEGTNVCKEFKYWIARQKNKLQSAKNCTNQKPQKPQNMSDLEKLKYLLSLVKDMRAKQKAYFKSRKMNVPSVTQQLLDDSKAAERLLDEVVDTYSKPQDTQTQLF